MSFTTQLIERMEARLQGGPALKVMKDDESFSLQPHPIITR